MYPGAGLEPFDLLNSGFTAQDIADIQDFIPGFIIYGRVIDIIFNQG